MTKSKICPIFSLYCTKSIQIILQESCFIWNGPKYLPENLGYFCKENLFQNSSKIAQFDHTFLLNKLARVGKGGNTLISVILNSYFEPYFWAMAVDRVAAS